MEKQSKLKNELKDILKNIMLIIGGVLVGISVGFIFLPVKLSTGGFSRNCYGIILFI